MKQRKGTVGSLTRNLALAGIDAVVIDIDLYPDPDPNAAPDPNPSRAKSNPMLPLTLTLAELSLIRHVFHPNCLARWWIIDAAYKNLRVLPPLPPPNMEARPEATRVGVRVRVRAQV